MASPLYTRDILRLAASIPHLGRLDHPHGTAERHSQVCGSRVLADVRLDGGTVTALGLEVNACALGQASAALMARHAVGRTAGELQTALQDLRAFLTGAADTPGIWPGLDQLEVARGYPARHPSILLPFEAVAEATRAATIRDAA